MLLFSKDNSIIIPPPPPTNRQKICFPCKKVIIIKMKEKPKSGTWHILYKFHGIITVNVWIYIYISKDRMYRIKDINAKKCIGF